MSTITNSYIPYAIAAGAAVISIWFFSRRTRGAQKLAKVSASKKNEPNSRVVVTDIIVYPIKSCGGISLASEQISTFSFKRDRRWMIVREDTKRFVTQRQFPKLSLVKTALDAGTNSIVVSAPNMPTNLVIPFDGANLSEPSYEVGIWDDTCPAVDEGDVYAEWFSKYLDVPVRLVRTPENMQRIVEEKYRAEGAENTVGWGDGFPFLLISEASLQKLNQMIGQGDDIFSMKRFRPNIVVSGTEPFEEDSWKVIQIGDATLHNVKPCSRCKLTTVVPERGEFGDSQPLATIQSKLRGRFGQNLMHSSDSCGISLSKGQQVVVVDYKDAAIVGDDE